MSSAETESLKGTDKAEESPKTWQEKVNIFYPIYSS